MSHLSVRTLIEDKVKQSDDSVLFGYARSSDFNTLSSGKKETTRVNLGLLRSSLEYNTDQTNLIITYQVAIAFYKLDDIQGAEKETADCLDKMDKLSNEWLAQMQGFSNDDELSLIQSNRIEMTSIRKTPMIKVMECMTGFLVELNLITPDDFNYCTIFPC